MDVIPFPNKKQEEKENYCAAWSPQQHEHHCCRIDAHEDQHRCYCGERF